MANDCAGTSRLERGPVSPFIGKQLARIMECPVCYELFEEPKTLHCGHSLCSTCARKMRKKKVRNPYDTVPQDYSFLTCPLCRQVTSFSGETLPTNTTLQSIVKRLLEQQQKTGNCASCRRYLSYEAQILCGTCIQQTNAFELLCLNCALKGHARNGHSVFDRKDSDARLEEEILPHLRKLAEKARWRVNDSARSAKAAASFLTDITFLDEAAQVFFSITQKLELVGYCNEERARQNICTMERLSENLETAAKEFDQLLGNIVDMVDSYRKTAEQSILSVAIIEKECKSESQCMTPGADKPAKKSLSRRLFGTSSELALNKLGKQPIISRQQECIVYVCANFEEMGLRESLLRNVASLFSQPTVVQKHLVHPIINGYSAIAEAPVKYGKLSAACMAMLQNINLDCCEVQALIFVPDEILAAKTCAFLNELWDKGMLGYFDLFRVPVTPEQFKSIRNIRLVIGTMDQIANFVQKRVLSVAEVKTLIFYDTHTLFSDLCREHGSKVLKWLVKNCQSIMLFTTMSLKELDVAKQCVKRPVCAISYHDHGYTTWRNGEYEFCVRS